MGDLTNEEKQNLKNQLKGKISIKLTPSKNDYSGDYKRGSVEWNPKERNYSHHSVIIPDGTTVKNSNFAQAKPHTTAVIGKNLTFIECNLNNVEVDPTWHFQTCLLIHSKKIVESDTALTAASRSLLIRHCVENKLGEFVVVNKKTKEMTTEEYNKFNDKLGVQNGS